MIRKVKIRRPLIALILMGIWLSHSLVSAQSGILLRVSNPNTDQFPLISMSISITDDTGRHVPNLLTQNFIVLEDGEAIGVDRAEAVTVGTRQIFVLNTSRGLRGRDSFGLTRYDYVRSALIEWWGKNEAAIIGVDDLNLMSVDGNLVLHSSFAAELSSAISSYEPEFQEEFASFDILLNALELSADPSVRVDMPTLIFFITPIITEPQELPLANTISWAKDNGITIYPILVGPEEILEYPEVDNLELLAEATGGEMIFYNADVGLEFLADRILTRRNLYELGYTSKANSSGSHNIQVRVTSETLDVISDPTSFPLNISTPEVIFTQAPDKIVRETDDPTLPLDSISPTSTTLQVLVLFPDGYPREVVSSQFILDDQLVSVHSEPPFDTFQWDLSEVQESATYEIKVTVEDSLGLQGSTVALPVSIEVITPPSGVYTFFPELGTILTVLGIVAFTGIIVASIITKARRRSSKTPSASQETRSRTEQRQFTRLRRRTDQALVEAILDPISSQMMPITLVGTDLVLGRDASISATHIDDPSVSPLHARLIRLASGDYLIRDQGSVAGTWVNYHPVPERGKILQHGDTIHLGRVSFRFQLQNPPPESRFHVQSMDLTENDAKVEFKGSRETSND